jgi:hypothetical protein
MTSSVDPGPTTVDIWPPRVHLSPSQRRQVLDHIRRNDSRCPSCGGSTFLIGNPGGIEAFHDEGDTYQVVVKCAVESCKGSPWSVRLRARQFLHAAGR